MYWNIACVTQYSNLPNSVRIEAAVLVLKWIYDRNIAVSCKKQGKEDVLERNVNMCRCSRHMYRIHKTLAVNVLCSCSDNSRYFYIKLATPRNEDRCEILMLLRRNEMSCKSMSLRMFKPILQNAQPLISRLEQNNTSYINRSAWRTYELGTRQYLLSKTRN